MNFGHSLVLANLKLSWSSLADVSRPVVMSGQFQEVIENWKRINGLIIFMIFPIESHSSSIKTSEMPSHRTKNGIQNPILQSVRMAGKPVNS